MMEVTDCRRANRRRDKRTLGSGQAGQALNANSVCPGAGWGAEGPGVAEERYAPGAQAAFAGAQAPLAAFANGEAAKPACPECGKLYSNNSNLKQHILNVHSARDLSHSCPVCGKAFKTRQYMQIHMNSIHGVKQRRREPATPPAEATPACARYSHLGA